METTVRLNNEQMNTLLQMLLDKLSLTEWQLNKANEKIDELHRQIKEMDIEKEGNF